MTKEEQTTDVKVQLYELTSMFVKAYQSRFYNQYRGDIEDLVSDFYLQFLTPKAREKGKEESLLDKFDPSITTLPYVVKVAVQRMLIDRSRKDKGESSLDERLENQGDFATMRYSLIDDKEASIDDLDVEPIRRRAVALFAAKPESEKSAICKFYQQVRNVLALKFQSLFDEVIQIPETQKHVEVEEFYVDIDTAEHLRVVQVTEKSIQLLHGTVVVTYNKETGKSRGKSNYQMTEDSLTQLLEVLEGRTFKVKL